MSGWKITIWCDTPDDMPQYDLAMALEQGELWDKASGIQYDIQQVTAG